MTMLMGWLKRFRHGRGFGVHSPFAFRFITEVLRETLPYYDYERLDNHRDRLLYRVACRFNPDKYHGDNRARQVISLVCPKAQAVKADMAQFIVAAADIDSALLTDAIAREALIYIRGRHSQLTADVRCLLDAANYGMTFDNERDTLIIVPHHKLPRQDFPVKF